MGGHSNSSDTTTTYRYAPYVEQSHSFLLDTAATKLALMLDDSPYADYTPVDVAQAWFGVGYSIASFPSLYDMFGKFVAGLDIEDVWTSMFQSAQEREEIRDSVEADAAVEDDLLGLNVATFSSKMRDLNAVCSSSFTIGLARIEDYRIKSIAAMDLVAREALLESFMDACSYYLRWMDLVIKKYALLMKEFYAQNSTMNDANYSMVTNDRLWALKCLQYMQKFFQALMTPQALYRQQKHKKRSAVSGVLLVASDTVTGAYIGFQVGAYPGAIVGAVVGFVVGVASWILE